MERTEAAGPHHTRAHVRPTAVWIVALTVAAVLAQVVGAPSPATAAAPADAKIEAGLLALPDGEAVDFWVTFTAKADVATAGRGKGWEDRGRAVVDGLQRAAASSQAGIARLLAGRGVKFESYWVANTAKVHGPKSLMRELAARPEVAKVDADRTLSIPEPAPAADPSPAAVEWNLAAINAPVVWTDLGVTGQGIVVANLDTGVQFDHPALVGQYRGNLGNGSFDHNYNWFDPSNVCGSPSVVPCDNNRHGTHTMGTMVGDAVGVAPGARWIAVKGCESSSCSESALLAGGQWLLAPTDLNGQNPRPDLRPNIVNNSWGGDGGDTWYRDMVTSWVAAGIFPAFAVGNSGPSCGSAGSPGDYAESYAVGASTSTGGIASFSSRGSTTGVVKPDITAPGDSVRSTVPGGYATLSGTSMATPHVAATVALMWSAAPRLIGDVAATRTILDSSAVDVADLTCGGTAADNAVWGEGRLDALAAVLASPRGPMGTVAGTVLDQATGLPLAGAQVRSVAADGFPRTATTSAAGIFTQRLPAGTVDIRVTVYGYADTSAQVTVAVDETKAVTIALVPLPRHTVSGRVFDGAGAPQAGASVSIAGAPIPPVVADATGFYRIAGIPDGDRDVSASGLFCLGIATRTVHLIADVTVDLSLPVRHDTFGYSCQVDAPAYVEAGTLVPLIGDDTFLSVALPFPFSYYGKSYGTVQVSTNGVVGLDYGTALYSNRPIPDAPTPNTSIYAFWDDLVVDSLSSVRTASLGTEPDRQFVIEWRNVRFFSGTTARFDFEVILDQRGAIVLQYRGLVDDAWSIVRGNSATIGIENETGTVGLPYSYNQVALGGSAMALRFEAAGSVGNTPPDAVADTATTVANRAVAIPVLANDRDADGDPLRITSAVATTGSAAPNGNVVNYTPPYNFVGSDVVTYDIADGRGGTDRTTVTVTVAPLAVDDTASTTEDTPVDILVLANDLNPQGGTLAVYGIYSPAHGTADGMGGGVIRYTPLPNFNGSDSFVYTVRDGLGGLDAGTVTIAVSPVDDPPRAVNDTADVAQDGVTTVPVLANDTEVDGELLQVVAVSDPPHGAAVLNADTTVTYRPDQGYAGPDSFTYDISDGHTVARATVTVTVRAPVTTTSTTTTTTTTTTTLPPTTTTTTLPPTTTTTRLPGTATMKAPYSLWTQPSPAPLDGLGTWIGTLNDPVARAGQVTPEYVYAVSFGYVGSPVRGIMGLTVGPAGKTAVLSISGPGVATQNLSVPLNWVAGDYYFLFVMQFQPGIWGALVYDLVAATWTPIGGIEVPAAWGQLSPTALVTTGWTGAPAASCAEYPAANIILYAPTAFRATGASDAVLVQGGTAAGTCRSDYGAVSPGWYMLRTGTP